MKEEILSNEEIARVFAMYLGCECVPKDIPDLTYKVWAAPYADDEILTKRWWSVQTFDRWKPSDLSLLLTPLSKITDEDAIEVAKIMGYSTLTDTDMVLPLHYLAVEGRRIIQACISTGDFHFQVYQYLISKGYAVPLFFAPNHPCKGKTAIELGIASDATSTKDEPSVATAAKPYNKPLST